MNNTHQKLDFVEDHCYKLSRILLSIVKLWPYDRETIFAKVHRILICIIVLSTLCVQLTTFYTFKFSSDLLLMVLSYALPVVLCIIRYYLFYRNFDKVKEIWKLTCDDYNVLKDETERKIIQRYSCIVEHRIIRLTVFIVMGMTGYIFLESSPIILDIVLPLSETRPRKLHALTEYFIDDQTYFYAILCHWLIGVFLNLIIFISIAMFQTMYIHHICALLKITCYRIQNSIDNFAPSTLKIEDYTAISRISDAVKIHREALRHVNLWISIFTSTSLVDIVIFIATLSINLLRLLRSVILLESIEEIVTSIMIVVLSSLLMFLGNNYAQKVTDHHNEIFDNVYNVRWYKAPTKIQKLLLFIILKTTKTYAINISNMYIISLENFAKITSMSISYFTVLYSTMN